MVCPGDMADQGVEFLTQIFTEKLLWQNSNELCRLHIGKIAGKSQYKKKFPFVFLFHNLFPGTHDPFYDPKRLPFSRGGLQPKQRFAESHFNKIVKHSGSTF